MDGLDQSPLWGIIGVIIGLIIYVIKKDKRNIKCTPCQGQLNKKEYFHS